MADTARIRGNVGRMIDQGAPESDIDAYLAHEGVSTQQLSVTAGWDRASRTLDQMEQARTARDRVLPNWSQREIGNAQAGGAPMTAGERLKDVALSLPAGVAEGALGVIGAPGDLQGLIEEGLTKATGWPTEKRQALLGPAGGTKAPTSADLKTAVEGLTGPFPESQTPEGRYMRTVGQFAPGLAAPGSWARRIAGVLVPAVASESAGQALKGGPMETPGRVAAALAGGALTTGAMSGFNQVRPGVPGMKSAASGMLERSLGPDAEGTLAKLGPDAALLDAGPSMVVRAQGVALEPGPGRDRVVGALSTRDQGKNARLATDTTRELGPYRDPSALERDLKLKTDAVGNQYDAAVQGHQGRNIQGIVDRIDNDIAREAGSPKQTLIKLRDMLFKDDPQGKGQVLKSNVDELHRARIAMDELFNDLEGRPISQGVVTKFRQMIDQTMPPPVKALDKQIQELKQQKTALQSGRMVLRAGDDPTTPPALREEIFPMNQNGVVSTISPGQLDMWRAGARADIERMTGTKSNDVTALRAAVGGDGDWNREKLALLFGQQRADAIINAVDREAAFQQNFNDVARNSQTAMRDAAHREMQRYEPTDRPIPPIWNRAGQVPEAFGRMIVNPIANAVVKGRGETVAEQLVGALTKTGPDRDELVSAIRAAQSLRKTGGTTLRAELIRALAGTEAATVPARD